MKLEEAVIALKTAAIIPAYNEEYTISNVLSVLVQAQIVHEIIVVNDGSQDNTSRVARKFPIKVIDLPENLGKGGAMKVGAINTDADVLLFLDADLLGLTQEHLVEMLDPVLFGLADMSVGIFGEGRLATDLAQKIAPFLSGQRAMRRFIIDAVPELESTRYGVEVALSRYAEKEDLRVVKVNLKNLAQVMKEEKIGFAKGVVARMRMYWEILRSVR